MNSLHGSEAGNSVIDASPVQAPALPGVVPHPAAAVGRYLAGDPRRAKALAHLNRCMQVAAKVAPFLQTFDLKATLYHLGLRGIHDHDSLGCKVVAMRTAIGTLRSAWLNSATTVP